MIDRYHVLLGVVALGLGTGLVASDRFAPASLRARTPGLVLATAAVVLVLIGSVPWVPGLAVALVAPLPADTGTPPHPLGRWTWVVVLAALAGVWAAVPDTEPALVAAACLVPTACRRFLTRVPPGPVAAGVLAVLAVGAAVAGAAGRGPALWASVVAGAVLLVPWWVGRSRAPRGSAPPAPLVVVLVLVGLAAPRLVALGSSTRAAVLTVVTLVVVAVAVRLAGPRPRSGTAGVPA